MNQVVDLLVTLINKDIGVQQILKAALSRLEEIEPQLLFALLSKEKSATVLLKQAIIEDKILQSMERPSNAGLTRKHDSCQKRYTY